MIEAMACGTPVLAFRCGSVPEIVEDGVTGAIVDSMDEAIAALPEVIALNRRRVRRRFEQRFSATRMAKDYVSVYRKLLASMTAGDREVQDRKRPLSDGGHSIDPRLQIAYSNSTETLIEETPETPFYIPGTGSSTRPRRTLKQGDCFAVLDSHADIGATAGGPDGIFFCDTRYLSHLEILLNRRSTVAAGLERPRRQLYSHRRSDQPRHFFRSETRPAEGHTARRAYLFLFHGIAYQRLRMHNHGNSPFDVRLSISFGSDFADLFEVRGLRRDRRGTTHINVGERDVSLNYLGLDGKRLRTVVQFDPCAGAAIRQRRILRL